MPGPGNTGEKARFLVSRRLDGLLVGWLAVFVWIAFWAITHLHLGITVPDLSAVYWTGAVVTAAHFGMSYHLAYSGGATALRARPFALVTGPALLVALLAGVGVVSFAAGPASVRSTTGALVTAVYLLTTWHYVKQVYGVGRVGAAFAKVGLDAWDTRLLRYGLYPLWFVGAAQVLEHGRTYYQAGFRFGYGLLPAGTYSLLRDLAVVVVVPIAVAFVRIARRAHRPPPSLLVAPYAAAVLWLALPTSPVLTLFLLAPFHALQYLAIAHRATLAVAEDRPGRHGPAWWINVVAGAACGGLLFSRWVPQFLDRHLDPTGAPLLFTAAFFVFLNLHHYLIDATIWRSTGELVRAIARSRRVGDTPLPQRLAPAAGRPGLDAGAA